MVIARLALLSCVLAQASTLAVAQSPRRARQPVIDVHLHALPIGAAGAPGDTACADTEGFPPAEFTAPRSDGSIRGLLRCRVPLPSARTDEELMQRTLALLRRYNVYALTSGDPRLVALWAAGEPSRVWPAAADADTSVLRQRVSGGARALGEFGFQYQGLAPTDSAPMAVFAFAAAADLPIGIHMGLGPPGTPFLGAPQYRARLSNPLQLETVLTRYPALRLYVMHAGWPMLDEMIHMLYTYPQLYVDIGVISWVIPRPEFYTYLRRLVEAGFGGRILFGSDQMQWPDALPVAIRAIEQAPFLTAAQKRAILYDNAARFLRLPAEDIRRHHAGQ